MGLSWKQVWFGRVLVVKGDSHEFVLKVLDHVVILFVACRLNLVSNCLASRITPVVAGFVLHLVHSIRASVLHVCCSKTLSP